MIYMVEMDMRLDDREAEWHEWYLAHIRVLLTVPGFRASQRFRSILPCPAPYLALHQVDSGAIFESLEYRSRGGPGSTGEWRARHSNWRRNLLDGIDETPEVPQSAYLLRLENARDVGLPADAPVTWTKVAGLDRDAQEFGLAVIERPRPLPRSRRARRARAALPPDQRETARGGLIVRRSLALAGLIGLAATAALGDEPASPPVAAVVDGRLAIDDAQLPVFVSQDWTKPLPGIRRVVIVVHGYNRNAADYARNMMALGPPADTLVVAPQFLAPEDIATHHLPDSVLRWDLENWEDGNPALGPAALSSFDGFDAVLAKLTDRASFPNLSRIVLAGFSAGGQVVQRYAAVGKGEDAIPLRYVVGSPGTYVYFGEERPLPDGTFGAFPDAAQCPDYNRWKFGFAGGLPPYVAAAAASQGVPALEHRYVARDIVYLAGGDDTDPNHRLLNKTCAGEAQGPTRLARMQFFLADMKRRDGAAFGQPIWVVPGVAHNEAKVFGSACGRAALFDDGACPKN